MPDRRPSARRAALGALAATLLALAAAPRGATAQPVTDPLGDFLASYVGPQGGDLDVRSARLDFDGTTFRFRSTSAADLRTTASALFVWGVDRGQGVARFGALAPNVLFDAVIVVDPNGAAVVRDLGSGAVTTLDAGAVRIDGRALSVSVAASLLPSLGFDPRRYTANLWPRLAGGGPERIADFAPDDSNIAVTTPEPATLGLVTAGALLLGAVARRRRRA